MSSRDTIPLISPGQKGISLRPWPLLLAVCGIFCTQPTQPLTGGSDMPSGVSVVVVDSAQTPVTALSVFLRQIVLTPSGDSLTVEKRDTTDSAGRALFSDVPHGTSFLYAEDIQNSRAALTLSFPREESVLPQTDTLFLSSRTWLRGRLLSKDTLPAPLRVFIPGTGLSGSVDDSGYYILPAVARGPYDILFQNGETVNAVPLKQIRPRDTLYLRDHFFSPESSQVAVLYVPAYPVLVSSIIAPMPVAYQAGFEPPWYEGKDLLGITYVMPSTDTVRYAGPDTSAILYVVDKIPLREENDSVVTRLISRGYRVRAVDDDSVSVRDTAGIDLVYLSFSANPSAIRDMFTGVAKPVIASEDHLYPYLGYCDTASFGNFLKDTARISIVDPGHALAAGLTDTVVICENLSSEIAWARPVSAAWIIAVDPASPQSALLFVFETGDLLSTGSAPARRAGYYASSRTLTGMSFPGWRLFDALIDWMLSEKGSPS